jgi:hypothetical protein
MVRMNAVIPVISHPKAHNLQRHSACNDPRCEGGLQMRNSLINKIGGIVFATALVLGVGLATAESANAQYQNQDQYRRDRDQNRDQRRRDSDWRSRRGRGDGYPNLGGSFDLRQTALNAGYNEGNKAGRDDRRRNRQYEFRDERSFQKANKDFSSRFGDRGLYSEYFRLAFENGYADGYRGY